MESELKPKQKKPTILIVDDILKNLQVLGNTLIEEGYEISMASNGKTALKMLEKMKPDLILLDVMMPELSGFEVCEQIKSNAVYSDVPVIFLTAKTETEDIVNGFKIGGVDYITKPFKKEELLIRIKTHLDLKFSKEKILEQNDILIALNKEKNTFLGIAAHDLKNPLSAIMGLSSTMENDITGLPTGELYEFSKLIRLSAEQMFQIITDLLDINAIEEGKLNMHFSDFDVNLMLQNTVDKFFMRAKDKDIILHFTPDEDEFYVYADANKSMQILDNLVSNALKFSPFFKNIWITAKRETDFIRITVKDEGPGISEADKEKLFTKFAKLTARPTAHENTTGLGLSIVKRLLEEMKGKIWCESVVGEGASFILELPQRK
jgi:two-component system, sensor histidine kinase and response regulator